jgi:Uma2 family endonuclease
MSERVTVGEYLDGPEQTRPMELVYGVVREPAAPVWGHQAVVVRTLVLLEGHVRERGLGHVGVAPTDVVIDRDRALVVQPDVFFVSHHRASIVGDVVWGAPDLVVEVTSRRTATRDRKTKLRWYRQYGTKECWLVDPERERVTVYDFTGADRSAFEAFAGPTPVRSRVLPAFDEAADEFFPPRVLHGFGPPVSG